MGAFSGEVNYNMAIAKQSGESVKAVSLTFNLCHILIWLVFVLTRILEPSVLYMCACSLKITVV